MRVLQINSVYPVGSTGRITQAIHNHLIGQGHESLVIFGRGPAVDDPMIKKAAPEWVMKLQSLRARITGYSYGGCLISTSRILRLIEEIKPDVVHVHCVNAYMVNIYRLFRRLRRMGMPTVLTLHAEFMYTGGCSHSNGCEQWLTGCCKQTPVCPERNRLYPPSLFFNRARPAWDKMNRALAGFRNMTVCAVSDWVKDRAGQSQFFRGNRLVTVLNGVNTGDFYYREDCHDILDRLQLRGKDIVLHVTPDFHSEVKGGEHVLEMARRLKDVPSAVFLVVGNAKAPDACPDDVVFAPPVSNPAELARYYSMAKVTLLTSKRETFSLVTAESLCCGTPVVGFESGGPETFALPQYSRFVEQGDTASLELALRQWLNGDANKREVSAAARDSYSQQGMCQGYLHEYMNVLKTREEPGR